MKNYDTEIKITHLDGSKYNFSKADYGVVEEEGKLPKLKIETEHCGDFEFFKEDLMKVVIDGEVLINDEEDTAEAEYLTVGELKSYITKNNIPDNAKVYYRQIEDEYFTEGGWKNDTLMSDEWFERGVEENVDNGWIRAYQVFYNDIENTLKITAHY